MRAKSLHGQSPEEIRSALNESLAEGFKPTLGIVFISVKQDRNELCRIMNNAGIEIIGATSAGEFIDNHQSDGAIAILLLEISKEHYKIIFHETKDPDVVPASKTVRSTHQKQNQRQKHSNFKIFKEVINTIKRSGMKQTAFISILLTCIIITSWTNKKHSSFNDPEFDILIVNTTKQEIKMHWRDQHNAPFKTLAAVKKYLEAKHEKVEMLTNGGMYLENNIPVGLFIAESKELRPIDTARDKKGNFYLQPNGVFFLDNSGRGHILQTHEFLDSDRLKKNNITYATQSGPMLITNGMINSAFDPNSKNLNLRSGVGILPDGNVVFAISKSNQTNFFTFASAFKRLGCKNALFLDGAISRMYLKDTRPDDLGGDFGAIISVTTKK
jgi:uncharacterized protein YigE (DUF2233 family)